MTKIEKIINTIENGTIEEIATLLNWSVEGVTAIMAIGERKKIFTKNNDRYERIKRVQN